MSALRISQSKLNNPDFDLDELLEQANDEVMIRFSDISSQNVFDSIVDDINKHNKKILSIQLVSCNIQVLPSHLNLSNCHYVNIVENKIEEILCELPACNSLYCDNNLLTYLPDLPSVIKLSCANNKLTKLSNLDNVRELTCSLNKLTQLPNIPKCRELQCASNQISQLPEIPKVKILSCGYNKLTKLPQLDEVEHLNCANNKLTKLPNLPECRKLICSNNEIYFLPKLPMADEVYCDGNNITYVEKINNFIEILDITNNPKDSNVSLNCDEILDMHPSLEDFECDDKKKPTGMKASKSFFDVKASTKPKGMEQEIIPIQSMVRTMKQTQEYEPQRKKRYMEVLDMALEEVDETRPYKDIYNYNEINTDDEEQLIHYWTKTRPILQQISESNLKQKMKKNVDKGTHSEFISTSHLKRALRKY